MATRRPAVLVSATAAVLALGLVAVWQARDEDADRRPVLVSVEGGSGSPVPSESARDWASFADHLVVGQVVAEEPLARGAGDVSGGHELRRITFAPVEALWSRPQAPPMPDELAWVTYGWSIRDGHRVEADLEGVPRLVVGSRYLVPVVRLVDPDSGGAEWSPIGLSTVFVVSDDGVIDDGFDGGPEGATWVHESYLGSPTSAVADALSTAEAYPLAERLGELPAARRALLVERHRSR